MDIVKIDINGGGVFRVGIGCQQLRVVKPVFHRQNTALQRLAIAIAFGDQPLQQHNIAFDTVDNRHAVELYGASCRRALGGGGGEFERLLNGEVFQTFDLQDAPREDVFLSFFSTVSRPCLLA